MSGDIAQATEQENQTSKDQLDHMNEVFAAQKTAFLNNPYPGADERIAQLKRIKPVFVRHLDELTDAVSADFGHRSADETKLAEIMTSFEMLKYAIKNVKKWMRPSRRSVNPSLMPAKARVIYQPLGVVGIISPWNYPVYLALGPLVTALAAGNRVMIKMSEFTPRTAEIVKRCFAEIFDEDQVAVITGEAEVGAAFSKLPFDHVLFTGSTTVGRHIMRAAADNLTPVTLELGGKSPVIISNDIPMNYVVDRLAFGKCFNSGQTCVAPDYILCPKNRVDELTSALTSQISAMYPTIADNPDYTSIVNDRQYQRLQGLLEDAKSKGASLVEINPANESFTDSRKIPVTLVLNSDNSMKIMQEEIFGPLLPILTYDDVEDAVKFINGRPRPLALYCFDFNKTRINYVLENTHSGGVCVNDTMSHVGVDDMPFGGVGESGIGHYHGHEGFLTLSKAKSVYEKGRINAAKFALPPYGQIHKMLYKVLLK